MMESFLHSEKKLPFIFMLSCVCETMMELDFNNSLHKISCPTLLLYGEKDTANKNASIELAELLKNVELKTIIGAGHEVNIESPQELAEILHAFYERMS